MSDLTTTSRVSHPKTRNGCITCKERHIRCGEERPGCSNCTRSGRDCQGYPELKPITRKRGFNAFRGFKNFSVAELSQRPTQGLSNVKVSQPFDYFFNRTIPIMSKYFPGQTWINTLLSVQESQPALRQCCIALGGLHDSLRRYNLAPGPLRASHQSDANDTVTLQQYVRAIRALRTSIMSNAIPKTAVLLASIILTIYESLQGRREEMLVHLRTGLWMIYHENQNATPDEVYTLALLSRLGFLRALSGQCSSDASLTLQATHVQTVTDDCIQFTNLVTARTTLDGLLSRVLNATHAISQKAFPDDFSACCAQAKIERSLVKWIAIFNQLAKQPQFWEGTGEKSANILLAQYELALIFVRAYSSTSQLVYDQYLENFKRIVHLLDQILGQEIRSRPEVFSLGIGLIPLLFFTGSMCRHPTVRRHAIDLLANVPQRDGIWESDTAAKTARTVMDLEEQGGSNTDPSCAFGIPEERRVRSVDMYDPFVTGRGLRVLIMNVPG